MTTFRDLYKKVLSAYADDESTIIKNLEDYDYDHLDCLLYPEKHPLIWQIDKCDCDHQDKANCI